MIQRRSLADFFFLGGFSLLALPLLYFLFPPGENHSGAQAVASLFLLALVLDFTINFPHFAYSYLIFYRNIWSKLTGKIDAALTLRYWFAGIVVPSLLVGLLVYGVVGPDHTVLGYLVNFRLFTLGWHYAKQGLGILSLLNREKGCQISRIERTLFHTNTHLVWLAIWSHFNRTGTSSYYIGIPFQSFELPPAVIFSLTVLAGLSSLATVLLIIMRGLRKGEVSFSTYGVLAYFSAAYLWIFFRLSLGETKGTILAFAFSPLFHSLQYYTIVHRYEKNRGSNLLELAAIGILLGAFGFSWAPQLLAHFIDISSSGIGPIFFKFAFWTFLNIHHFFIDNVSWRQESASVHRYLITK